MTKTTEELKREMYRKLEGFKIYAVTLEGLESALEAYLEMMRQESVAKDVRIDHLERMGDVMRDGYMYQQQLTAQARTEADRERNRCQAFEFANKSAGEFLAEARAKLKAQRQHFGKLKNERDNFCRTVKVRTTQRDGLEAQLLEARRELSELRKLLPGTSAKSSEEKGTGVGPGAMLPHERRLDADECAHRLTHGGMCVYCRGYVGGSK